MDSYIYIYRFLWAHVISHNIVSETSGCCANGSESIATTIRYIHADVETISFGFCVQVEVAQLLDKDRSIDLRVLLGL